MDIHLQMGFELLQKKGVKPCKEEWNLAMDVHYKELIPM